MAETEDRASNDTRLSREVLVPQAPTQGVGVMLVAATAMMFAVTGSALMVRAKTSRHHCGAAPAAVEYEATTANEAYGESCGVPEYRTNADGTSSVVFQVCPGDVRTIRLADPDTADESELARPRPLRGVEVGQIDLE